MVIDHRIDKCASITRKTVNKKKTYLIMTELVLLLVAALQSKALAIIQPDQPLVVSCLRRK